MFDELVQLARSTKYPLDAYIFVQRGLDYTVKGIHGDIEKQDPEENRHVSGPQLCNGLREFAIEQYGLMARTVLRWWNITNCEDFGQIVFFMVEAELMQQTDQDSLEDFVDVYDFSEVFSPRLQLT